MAKKQTAPARTTLEEVNESLTGTAQKIEKNKKVLTWAAALVLGLVAIGAAYYYFVHMPNKEKATELVGKADRELIVMNDTVNALKDYEAAAGDVDRAAVNAAIILYQQGKYQEAAKYLEDYSAAGTIVGPASQSLLGDCYVNLKQLDKAVSAFDKAIKLSDGNELLVPVFMRKKATVLHELKKYAEEADLYQSLKDNYPAYLSAYSFNVDKYIERANALAGK